MKYIDIVYGSFEVTEPVILELIYSSALQRLKDIDQGGYPQPFFSGASYSRFEHSVGVYLLLNMYGAPIEEQVAGLIHDVSHSAFSHCIDYALDAGSEKEQSYQDTIFERFVRRSEIPDILEKYKFDPDYIFDDAHFPLKETKLPDVCADRIDYSLRTACEYGEAESGRGTIQNLTAEDGRWVFTNFESAESYAEFFLDISKRYYAGFASAVMLRTVGTYVRYALAQGYITEDDLYTTDKIVLEKIKPHIEIDPTLKRLSDRMNNRIGCNNSPGDYDERVFVKSRAVDPLCWHDGQVKRISEIKPVWSDVVAQESQPKEYFLKFDR